MTNYTKEESIALIEALSNAKGAPGFEDEVVNIIKEKYGEQFTIQEDSMRNLMIYRKNHSGNKPVIMLDGHSDEVAFIVQSIRPNGTLKFLPLGGWVTQTVPAHKVLIKNSEGHYIEGIIGSRPPHFGGGDGQKLEDMIIDVGATSYEEVVDLFKIEVGAPVVPDTTFSYNKTTEIMLGKAFDNRLGCGCVIETLLALEGLELDVDVVGAISVQEEVGCRGAKVNVKNIKPNMAIIFEGSPADDTFMDRYEAQGCLKKGAQIRHFDRSFIANPRLIEEVKKVAREKEIPYQCAVRSGGGTDAGPIHLELAAVPCLVLGVPVRYAHTHYGYAAMKDYKASIELAVEYIKTLSEETIAKL